MACAPESLLRGFTATPQKTLVSLTFSAFIMRLPWESCSFRIVTLREVNSALKVLTYPFSSPARNADQEVIKQLCADVCNKLSGSKSPNGNDGSFWVLRAIWDVRGSEQAVRNDNLLSINSLVHDRGGYLAPDQLGEFYQKLLSLVRDAALAEWEADPTKKKITRDTFLRWFERTLREAQFPASSGTGSRLIAKMRDAGLNQDYIDTALEQRAAYRRESLSPQYLSLSDVELTAREVSAYLTCLRSELDAGLITDDGIQFHHRCLNALNELQAKIRTNSEPHLSFLQGCMYDITNRCLHRFVRAKS